MFIKKNIITFLFTVFFSLMSSLAFAGTGGAEFETLVDTIIEYATGYPAMGVLAIGFVIGIVRMIKGEAAIFAWVVVAGLIVASLDTILNTMVTALI